MSTDVRVVVCFWGFGEVFLLLYKKEIERQKKNPISAQCWGVEEESRGAL